MDGYVLFCSSLRCCHLADDPLVLPGTTIQLADRVRTLTVVVDKGPHDGSAHQERRQRLLLSPSPVALHLTLPR